MTLTDVDTLEQPRLIRNPRRGGVVPPPSGEAFEWHRSLDGYVPTPLVSLPMVAEQLGLQQILVKDESARFGLPSFKFLGASWATRTMLALRETTDGSPTLVTATDGNHGRAVARVARELGVEAIIFVPTGTSLARIAAIRSEGALVRQVRGNYDHAVRAASSFVSKAPSTVLISDTSPFHDDTAAQATIEGYGTIFWEIEEQLRAIQAPLPDLVVLQIGVGGLAAAGVRHFRSRETSPPLLIGVEPQSAACAFESIRRGTRAQLQMASSSAMVGLISGILSAAAWPTLRDGLDASMTVADDWCSPAIQALGRDGVMTEATGASGLAGLMALRAAVERGASPVAGSLSMATSALVIATEGLTG